MRHSSLFSGIGGFDLAAKWMGWENVFQCEIDSYCNAILKKHFPTTIRYGNIKQEDFTRWNGSIDIISGGPPCQAVSKAGKRRGKADERWLFPEYKRVLSEVAPRWAVIENVRNLLRMGINEILDDLEEEGYISQPYLVPASAVGAFHNRERIWIVALKKDAYDTYTNSLGPYREEEHQRGSYEWGIEFRHQQISLPGSLVSQSVRNGTDPRIFGATNGISHRVDRIKSVGNAISPQVALQIFKAIQKVDNIINQTTMY